MDALVAAAAEDTHPAAHPISGLTSDESQRYSTMGEADLLRAVHLMPRISSYAPSLTPERMRALQAVIARRQRHDMHVDEHFLAALKIYEDSGWAVAFVERDSAPTTATRSHVRVLRVFLQSPAMQALVARFPHVTDVSAIDATFTIGSVPIHTYAWVGHLPESGGDAIPLAFFLTLAAPDEDVPTRTDNIRWFLEQCLQRNLQLPELMLVDKCAATFKAMALVAHDSIASEQGQRARADATAALHRGAAGCSDAARAAARRLLSLLNADSRIEEPPAASGDMSTATVGVAGFSAASTGVPAMAGGAPRAPSASAGALAGGAPRAPLASAGAMAGGAPRAPLASADAGADSLLFPRCAELLDGLVLPPIPAEQQAVLAAVLKPETLANFGPLGPALCAVLLEDLTDAERRRQLETSKSFAALQDATTTFLFTPHCGCATASLGRSYAATASTLLPSATSMPRRLCLGGRRQVTRASQRQTVWRQSRPSLPTLYALQARVSRR